MQLADTQVIEPVTTNELVTWARQLTHDDLQSFISRRSIALGDLDDDDFELASL